MNFYAYAGNDPISSTDPLGLQRYDRCLSNVKNFVDANLAYAQALASALGHGTTPQEVLATAGAETQWGAQGTLADYGNYFGLHGTGYAGQIDTYTTRPRRGSGVLTPVFPLSNGFLPSGQVFVNTVAQYIAKVDASDPLTFFQTIHDHGWGTGNPDYVSYMMQNTPTKQGPNALVGACLAQ